jgi:hypothetical protein
MNHALHAMLISLDPSYLSSKCLMLASFVDPCLHPRIVCQTAGVVNLLLHHISFKIRRDTSCQTSRASSFSEVRNRPRMSRTLQPKPGRKCSGSSENREDMLALHENSVELSSGLKLEADAVFYAARYRMGARQVILRQTASRKTWTPDAGSRLG